MIAGIGSTLSQKCCALTQARGLIALDLIWKDFTSC